MTVEERIAAMDKKIANDKIVAEQEAARKDEKISAAMKEAEQVFDRVKDIIRLITYCLKNDIKFPNGKYQTYKSGPYNDFASDGIRHYFGYIGENGYYKSGDVIHLGWINGGYCGIWDVHCDGNELWLQNEKDPKLKKPADSVGIIFEFIEDFNKFEKVFYKWFDEACKGD